MVTFGFANDVTAFFGRAHVIDAQVKRRDKAGLGQRRAGGRATQIVEESREHAAMDDAGIRVTHQPVFPRLYAPGSAFFHFGESEAHSPSPWNATAQHFDVFLHQLPGFGR